MKDLNENVPALQQSSEKLLKSKQTNDSETFIVMSDILVLVF